jgi:multidrug transporter EmrE-like cation transporter
MTAMQDSVVSEPTRLKGARVNLSSLVVLLVAVGLAALGQVLLKHGMTQAASHSKEFGRSLPTSAIVNPWVWVGLLVFGLSAMAWMLTLSRVPLNVAYPFNALGYIAVLTASVAVLHEKANAWTVLGSLMVVFGLIVVVTMSPSHQS